MLRLRCNTLWQVDGKHNAAYDKAVVDSFDLCVAENYKVTEVLGKKHKKHKRNIDNVKMVFDDEQIQLSCVAPGLLLEVLTNKDFHETRVLITTSRTPPMPPMASIHQLHPMASTTPMQRMTPG